MKHLAKLNKHIATGMEWVSIVMISGVVILSITAVILRYVFNIVFIQQEEAITFLFIASVFFGLPPIMYRKTHVSVDLLQDALSPKKKRILKIIQYVIVSVVHIVLVYSSFSMNKTNKNFLTPGLRIPFWTIYSVFPIGIALSFIISVSQLIEYITAPFTTDLDKKEV